MLLARVWYFFPSSLAREKHWCERTDFILYDCVRKCRGFFARRYWKIAHHFFELASCVSVLLTRSPLLSACLRLVILIHNTHISLSISISCPSQGKCGRELYNITRDCDEVLQLDTASVFTQCLASRFQSTTSHTHTQTHILKKLCAIWLPLRAFCGSRKSQHINCVYWLIEGKNGKKVCKLTHTAAFQTTTIILFLCRTHRTNVLASPSREWERYSTDAVADGNAFFLSLNGMQIVEKTEKSVKRSIYLEWKVCGIPHRADNAKREQHSTK